MFGANERPVPEEGSPEDLMDDAQYYAKWAAGFAVAAIAATLVHEAYWSMYCGVFAGGFATAAVAYFNQASGLPGQQGPNVVE